MFFGFFSGFHSLQPKKNVKESLQVFKVFFNIYFFGLNMFGTYLNMGLIELQMR